MNKRIPVFYGNKVCLPKMPKIIHRLLAIETNKRDY